MRRLSRLLCAAFALSGPPLLGSAVQAAMPIQVFDRMSEDDQIAYLDVMLLGAEQLLKDEGRPDLVEQIKKLFTTRQSGDDNTIGMVELELNLAAVSKADADNLVKNPNARPLAVELAMIATLKANGIVLPKSFMHVGDNFRPKDLLSPAPTIPNAASPRP
jgi:hypothetical protein